jgi:hypothetical protein
MIVSVTAPAGRRLAGLRLPLSNHALKWLARLWLARSFLIGEGALESKTT